MSDHGMHGAFDDVADGMRGLRAQFAQLQQAWPDDASFEGKDSSGAVSVTMTGDGHATQVTLDADWRRRVDERSLARAVNEAIGAATVGIADSWFEELNDQEAAGSSPFAPPRAVADGRPFARLPEPPTPEELSRKSELSSAARGEYDRWKRENAASGARETFESPRGYFRVTHSAGNLLGLEFDANQIALVPPDDIGQEIVACLDEASRRFRERREETERSYPALAELRSLRRHS